MLSAQSLLVWPVVCIALFVLYLRNGRVHRNQIGRATGEEEARFVIPLLVDPCFQHSHCWFGQWCASLFSSFTFATDVCTGTERHVSLPQPSNLGEPQPCLYSQQQQGVVTSSDPGGFVHTAEQGLDFRPTQVSHQPPRVPLIRDRQHALDQSRVLRSFQCGVVVEGTK